MKPMNFPGRLNKRRQEALDRIARRTADEQKKVQKIVEATRAKLVEQNVAQSTRTKINREKQGK